MSFIHNVKSDSLLFRSIVCILVVAICHWIQFVNSGYLVQPFVRAVCCSCYIVVALIFGRKSWSLVLFIWAMALVYFNRFCNYTSFIMILVAVGIKRERMFAYMFSYALLVLLSLYLYKDSFTHLIIHAGGCYFFYIVYSLVIQKIYPEDDKNDVIETVGYKPVFFKKKKTAMVLDHLSSLGRPEKEELLNKSPLNDRESEIISLRFIRGLSLKESSEELKMEYDTFAKAQKRALDKLYSYIFPK